MLKKGTKSMKDQTSYHFVLRLSLFCVLGMSCIAPSIFAQKRKQVRVPKEIAQIVMNDNETRECIQQNGGADKNLKAESIYLNRNRTPDILVQGAYPCTCGVQNCTYWIYRKSANGYELLLTIDSAINVVPKNIFTNGYRDINIEAHFSALETYISTYKFDGQKYQSKGCVIRSYLDKNGRQLKRPIFKKC